MPLYFENQTTLTPGSRSNTQLRKSGGDSPGEHWLTDPGLPKLFTYEYGGDGQKDVAVAKGMVVAAGPRVNEIERGNRKANTLTIANGVNKPIGMAPYNFAVYTPDLMKFNSPAIITRDYVELPVFPNAADAAAVKWGAVHGTINPGDMLMASPSNPGQITVWDGQLTTIHQIVGQALAIEDDLEPWGWFKWALHPETAKYDDAQGEGLNQQKKGLPSNYGYPYDAEYRKGVLEADGYLNPYLTYPTGITGLHDGANKSQVVQQKNFVVPMGSTAGTRVFVDLDHRNVVKGTLSVAIGANPARADAEFEVDYSAGRMYYTVPADVATTAATGDVTFAVKFRSLFAGTPSGWDFAGAVGAVRLLLKF